MTYNIEISKLIHELASALYQAGGMDKEAMKEFDKMFLTDLSLLTEEDIKNEKE